MIERVYNKFNRTKLARRDVGFMENLQIYKHPKLIIQAADSLPRLNSIKVRSEEI